MPGWIDNNWLRIGGYLVVVALALLAARRENPDDPGTWRPFWFLTAALLLAMAAGRAVDLAHLAGDELRAQARSSGWYESRRKYQAVVVAALGIMWLAMVFTAVWRVPERRRRYLPMIVAVVTLAVYAAIRVVSLHQIDGLLYRRRIADVRCGTAIEFTLLAFAAVCTCFARSRTPRHVRDAERSNPRRPQRLRGLRAADPGGGHKRSGVDRRVIVHLGRICNAHVRPEPTRSRDGSTLTQ